MKEFVEKLQYLGIPKREGEVFLALLQKNEFTATEISKITSVSRTKSYEILQNLVKKGLCKESYRNGIKAYSCIGPKIVIENILSDYEKKKRVADELLVTLNKLFKKNEKVESPLDYIEVLTDREQVKEKWFTILKNTKKELLVFTKPPYADILTNNVKRVEDIKKSNVVVKSVYEYKDLTPKGTSNLIKTIELFQEIGEKAMILYELPMKLCICDETITMLSLKDKISLEPTTTTIVIEHPSFALAQKEVFNSYWQKGISIENFKGNQNKYLSSI
jgi:HTH-type transcriptional regulator, sugar sensing transcriptional regulator